MNRIAFLVLLVICTFMSSASAQEKDPIVYHTPSGSVYHTTKACSYLSQATKILSCKLSETNLKPCSKCGDSHAHSKNTGPTAGISSHDNQQKDVTVYTTKTGTKYHRTSSCSGLRNAKSVFTSTKSAAEKRGLTPCSICYKK